MNAKQISIIIIAVIATALITYFVIPTKTVTHSQTVTVADTGTIAKAEYQKALKQRDETLAEVTGLKKLLKLSQTQPPFGGGVTNPQVSPIDEVKPIQPSQPTEPQPQATTGELPRQDSASMPKMPVLYPYDFPISGKVTGSKITFLTTNPFLRYYGLPYVKTYEFNRTTSDFEFALGVTEQGNILNGIKLIENERFLSFDGLSAGAGIMFPKSAYAIIEAKFSMYERLHIDPRVTSRPEAGLELKYDIVR
jgi:hypothetical protein